MKNTAIVLLASIVAGVLMMNYALAQDSNTISAPVVQRQALPPVNVAPQTEGSLQRGVRLGNPAQMFNPFASVKYGDGHKFVTARLPDKGLQPPDNSREHPIALRLFSFTF
jgi:hypothetical protein